MIRVSSCSLNIKRIELGILMAIAGSRLDCVVLINFPVIVISAFGFASLYFWASVLLLSSSCPCFSLWATNPASLHASFLLARVPNFPLCLILLLPFHFYPCDTSQLLKSAVSPASEKFSFRNTGWMQKSEKSRSDQRHTPDISTRHYFFFFSLLFNYFFSLEWWQIISVS